MFFTLPINAVVANWLGDWLFKTLTENFEALELGQPFLVTQDGLLPEQSTSLANHVNLMASIVAVLQAYQNLGAAERQPVRKALEEQINVSDLLAGGGVGALRADLGPSMQTPLNDLSKEAFKALTNIGVRKQSYAAYFADDRGRTCAFCGYESIDSNRVRNADWDHYLARSLYPFAAFNLRNLTPMSDGCNRTYKGAKDMLRAPNGARRRSFDPYVLSAHPARVHLRASQPIGAGGKPSWLVTIDGDAERVATWDAVFEIRARWKDQLDARYRSCLRQFANNFQRAAPPNDDLIMERLATEAIPAAGPPLPGDDLLRNAIFDMWHAAFAPDGPHRARLAALFRDVVRQQGRP